MKPTRTGANVTSDTSPNVPSLPQTMPSPAREWTREPHKEGPVDKRLTILVTGVYAFLIFLGIVSGYFLFTKMGGTRAGSGAGAANTQKSTGGNDTQTFKDTAVGVVEAGGIDGEGTHKLIRDGGPSQTACLISSVLDLDPYVGKKVKVWSKTEAPKKCAWLMDVGKIEQQ